MKYCLVILLFLIGCVSTDVTNPYGYKEIPIIELKGMRFIDITLNGTKTKLLIDTGASKSLLDISKAKKFDFKYNLFKENQYVGLGGVRDIYIPYDYTTDEIFISFLASDLSEIQNYFTIDDIYIVGILGIDFLERYEAIINFNTNILYIKK